jgi:hypothetical protein
VGEKLKKLDKFTHCSAITKYPGNKLESVISHVIVYTVLGCCEVSTEIGAVKAAEGV